MVAIFGIFSIDLYPVLSFSVYVSNRLTRVSANEHKHASGSKVQGCYESDVRVGGRFASSPFAMSVMMGNVITMFDPGPRLEPINVLISVEAGKLIKKTRWADRINVCKGKEKSGLPL